MKARSIALGICVCAFSVSSVHGAILIVTTTADSGAGSLRDTIATASDGDTIQFDSVLTGQTIARTASELIIDKNIIIDGLGSYVLSVKRAQPADHAAAKQAARIEARNFLPNLVPALFPRTEF